MIKQVMQLIDQLIELLEHEKELLQKKDMKGVTDLLEKKESLSRSYEVLLSKVQENPRTMKDSAVVIKNKTEHLKNLMEENMDHLSLMAEANNSVLNALLDKIMDRKSQVCCYNPFGSKETPVFQRTASFSVDQYI